MMLDLEVLIDADGAVEASAARNDFAAYCKFVHDFEMCEHLHVWHKELYRNDVSKTLIVAPPETYKSTLLRYETEYHIGKNPDECTLLIMNTATQAMKQVMAIAETIEGNVKYQEVFPHVKPDTARGWSKDTLFITRPNRERPDPTLYGTGIDGPYQGLHVERLIIDDPTDQQDVRSETTMSQQRERLQGVLIDRVKNGGRIWAILTRWGESDLTNTMKNMGFQVLEQPIEGRYSWGRLLCPTYFPDTRLADIKQGKQGDLASGMSGDLWTLTYLCDPSGSEGSMIRREWWKYYGEAPQFKGRPIHSWDLSTGRSSLGDYSGFGSWSVGENGYYMTSGGHWRLDMDGLIAKMLLFAETEQPQKILVEEVGTSIPVVEYLEKHTRLPVYAVKPGSRDKVARVQGVQHIIEAGRAWLPNNQAWVHDFIDECARFPGGQFDDQVDQMSQALDYLLKHGGYRYDAKPLFIGGRY
jgi:predicted phage terminase large subunit-like protein